MTTLIQSFGDELCKLAGGESPVRVRFKDFSLQPIVNTKRTTRVQSAPREFAKLGPKFKQLTPGQQKTERAVPGAYTHKAKPPPPSRGVLGPEGGRQPGWSWSNDELARGRTKRYAR